MIFCHTIPCSSSPHIKSAARRPLCSLSTAKQLPNARPTYLRNTSDGAFCPSLKSHNTRNILVRAMEDGWNEGGRYQEEQEDGMEERVVHVTRVSKTVKGGRNISFRATVVVGDRKGSVGVGNASAKEIATAVQRACESAKKQIIRVRINPKTMSFPHRAEINFGAARVMLRPAAEGTGVVAGGAVRVVLELAGIKNGFGKQLGSSNPMNNAKAAIQALKSMRTFKEVAAERGITVAFLQGRDLGDSEDDAQEAPGSAAGAPENTTVAEL